MRADPKAEIETNNIPPTAMTPYAIIDISCRFQMIKAIWMIFDKVFKIAISISNANVFILVVFIRIQTILIRLYSLITLWYSKVAVFFKSLLALFIHRYIRIFF